MHKKGGSIHYMNKKTILITGATSGVGLLIAKLCIEKQYDVYVTGRNVESLRELQTLGAHAIQADIRSKQEVDQLIEMLPSLDVAILNAGLGIFEAAHDLKDEEVQEMFDVNVLAPIYLARKILPKMMQQQKGHFIFMSSQAGKVATKKASVYAASKHAITGFINGFRLEVADANIHVTGIYPGPIDTPFLQKADAAGAYREAIKKFLLKPEQVANAVMNAIEHPRREVNLPKVMGLTSKLYAIAPSVIEFFGKGFFNKK